MKIIECVKAMEAIEKLYSQMIPRKVSHALWMLKKALEPHVQFFAAEQMSLVQLHARKSQGRVEWDKEGNFRFASVSDAEQYKKKFAELMELDVDVDYERKTLQSPELISVEIREKLEQFIIFEEVEDESK